MKKLLSAIASFALCALMLTACGSSDLKIAAEYTTMDEFVSADCTALETEDVAAKDSNTYDFIMSLEGATELYVDIAAFDGSSTTMMAIAADKMAMKTTSAEDSSSNMSIFIKDLKMYMLDDSAKSGYSYTIDESVMAEYNVEEILGEFDFDQEIDDSEIVPSCGVKIDGTVYTLEIAEEVGFLYDNSGKLYAIISDDTTVKVNAFTKEIPSSVFDIPSDYEIIDMDALAQ